MIDEKFSKQLSHNDMQIKITPEAENNTEPTEMIKQEETHNKVVDKETDGRLLQEQGKQSSSMKSVQQFLQQQRGDWYNGEEVTTIVHNDCRKEGYIRHATDCSIFYRCTAEAKFQYICEKGLAFHTGLKACIAREYVNDC